MHAVFMGMPSASRNGEGGNASLQSDGTCKKPEVVDEIDRRQPLTTLA